MFELNKFLLLLVVVVVVAAAAVAGLSEPNRVTKVLGFKISNTVLKFAHDCDSNGSIAVKPVYSFDM